MIVLVFILIVQIVFSFKKASYGLMIYLIIRLCIPNAARIGEVSLNTFSLILLLVSIFHTVISQYKLKHQKDQEYLRIIISLVSVLFILCLFAEYVPLSFQIREIIQFVGTELLPSILFLFLIRTDRETLLAVYVVIGCALFTAIYGLFTFIANVNPIYDLFEAEGNLLENELVRGGMEGMAVGVYNDSIYLSLVSLLLITFLFNKFDFIKNKKILSITIFLLMANLFITTKRSALLSLIVFFIILFFDKKYQRKVLKLFSFGIMLIILLTISFSEFTGLSNMLLSVLFFWDDKVQNNLDMGGSSNELRYMQLLSIINIIKTDMLQGLGYGFSHYYYIKVYDVEIYGHDPDFAGFESFAFKVLSASGIIGFIIWVRSFYKLKLYMTSRFKAEKCYASAFILSYLIAILMTDISGSMFLFFILVVLNQKLYSVD